MVFLIDPLERKKAHKREFEKMLLVLFGYPGVGKSFIGKMLQEEFGFYHYEADEDLTPPIKDAIQKNSLVTEPLKEAYFKQVCERIDSLKNLHPNIVVTQTFTKEKYRKRILERFPEAKFIRLQADMPVIYARLAKRDGHLVKNFYAGFAISQFEAPTLPHWILENNGRADKLHQQLNRMLAIQRRES